MLLTTTIPALSSDSAGRDLLSFADHLYAQGEYYRAITEYERVMFLYPGTSEAKTARFQIARSYFQSEKYTQAIERFLVDHGARLIGREAVRPKRRP